nr:coat protein [Bee Macula-like virus]
MELLLETLAPLLAKSLPSVSSTTPAPSQTSEPSATTEVKAAAPQSNAIVASTARIPATPSVVASPLSRDPCIKIPFQFALGTVSSADDKGIDYVFSSIPQSVKLVLPYRRARLLSLEAVLEPVVPLKNGYSIILCWTQANNTVSGADALAVPGAQLFSVTTYAVLAQSQILPAPLHALNSMVKDSVSYTDSPRLHLSPFKLDNPGAALLVLRGVLEVSSPALIANTA